MFLQYGLQGVVFHTAWNCHSNAIPRDIVLVIKSNDGHFYLLCQIQHHGGEWMPNSNPPPPLPYRKQLWILKLQSERRSTPHRLHSAATAVLKVILGDYYSVSLIPLRSFKIWCEKKTMVLYNLGSLNFLQSILFSACNVICILLHSKGAFFGD